jgi:hypothetical protein
MKSSPPNPSRERTPQGRELMVEVGQRRRSARDRYPELGAAGLYEITAPGQVRFRRKPAWIRFRATCWLVVRMEQLASQSH